MCCAANYLTDIVRDVVRSRLGGEDGIRKKQRAVVEAFATACAADGWEAEGAVGRYAEQGLQQHISEAILPDPLHDDAAHAWLLHTSELVVKSAAKASSKYSNDLVFR